MVSCDSIYRPRAIQAPGPNSAAVSALSCHPGLEYSELPNGRRRNEVLFVDGIIKEPNSGSYLHTY